MTTMHEAIARYATFSADWDSYGAPPFEPEHIARANAVADAIVAAGLPAANMSPYSGGISFWWGDEDFFIEVTREWMQAFDMDGEDNSEDKDQTIEEVVAAVAAWLAKRAGAPS